MNIRICSFQLKIETYILFKESENIYKNIYNERRKNEINVDYLTNYLRKISNLYFNILIPNLQKI